VPNSYLANFTGPRRWVLELSAIPTYVGAALLSLRMPGGFLAQLLAFLGIILVYHYLYTFLFPKYEFRGHLVRLAALVLVQIVAWPVLFWVTR
jgi:hypothetical protein